MKRMFTFTFVILLTNTILFGQVSTTKTTANASVNTTTDYKLLIRKLRLKIMKKINPTKVSKLNIVIGVRGNKYDSKTSIYWKNELSEELKKRIDEEKNKIDMLIKDLENIDKEDIKNLEKYIKENPDSYFIDDIKGIIDRYNKDQQSSLENN